MNNKQYDEIRERIALDWRRVTGDVESAKKHNQYPNINEQSNSLKSFKGLMEQEFANRQKKIIDEQKLDMKIEVSEPNSMPGITSEMSEVAKEMQKNKELIESGMAKNCDLTAEYSQKITRQKSIHKNAYMRLMAEIRQEGGIMDETIYDRNK